MDMISSYFARLIARELALPLDEPKGLAPLLAGTDLSGQQVLLQSEIPLQDFIGLLSNALHISQNPALGLCFGSRSHPYLSGEVGFASINAPNLQEALLGFVNYSAIQASYLRFEVSSDIEGLTLSLFSSQELGITQRTQHEVTMLSLQNFLQLFLGEDFCQGQYGFAYPAPDYQDEYRQVFHSPVSFDCAVSWVKIPKKLLLIPSMFSDEKLWLQGKLYCKALMQKIDNRHKKLFKQHVLAKLNYRPPPLPKLNDIAMELNVSPRTLARRLQEEGTHFRQLYQQVQMQWAQYYLTHSALTVENIAGELGFQDANNFRRAFKRHFNLSPQSYRQHPES